MIFIAAGFGGGTGTGATPVIAQIARDLDILPIAVVTKPFQFEGKKRMTSAHRGLRELRDRGVAMLTIPNEKLLSVISASTSMLDAFSITDQFLMASVQSMYRIFSQTGPLLRKPTPPAAPNPAIFSRPFPQLYEKTRLAPLPRLRKPPPDPSRPPVCENPFHRPC